MDILGIHACTRETVRPFYLCCVPSAGIKLNGKTEKGENLGKNKKSCFQEHWKIEWTIRNFSQTWESSCNKFAQQRSIDKINHSKEEKSIVQINTVDPFLLARYLRHSPKRRDPKEKPARTRLFAPRARLAFPARSINSDKYGSKSLFLWARCSPRAYRIA